MNWIEFAVYTTDEGLEPVYGALLSAGLDEVSMEEGEKSVAAHLEALSPYWDYADASALAAQSAPCVKAYIADIPENEALLENARLAIARLRALDLGIGALETAEMRVSDEDWANNWKQYYKPLPIGGRLLICPSWEKETLDPALAEGRAVMLLDPGMAFGTGDHHSTRLCLNALDRRIHAQARVLDIGCGSGILAIGALLLGAKSAVCVDIDPVATRTAHENAALNGLDDARLNIYTGDILHDAHLLRLISGQYDMVIANIVADVIIALCPLIPALLKPGGLFLCSGIVSERADDVKAALNQNGLSLIDDTRAGEAPESEWAALLAGVGV